MLDKNLKLEIKMLEKTVQPISLQNILANHDGNLDKALELINKSAEAGADAANFNTLRQRLL